MTGQLLSAEFAELPRFVDALPIRPVEMRTFPGFLPVSVYVFRKSALSAAVDGSDRGYGLASVRLEWGLAAVGTGTMSPPASMRPASSPRPLFCRAHTRVRRPPTIW